MTNLPLTYYLLRGRHLRSRPTAPDRTHPSCRTARVPRTLATHSAGRCTRAGQAPRCTPRRYARAR